MRWIEAKLGSPLIISSRFFDGPPRRGPGGFAPPQPGEILPRFLQESMNLNDDQRAQIAALQKEFDDRLDKVLTDSQRQQLRQTR